jgi:hypothetical protein
MIQIQIKIKLKMDINQHLRGRSKSPAQEVHESVTIGGKTIAEREREFTEFKLQQRQMLEKKA